MIIGDNRTEIYSFLAHTLARNVSFDFSKPNELKIISWDADICQEQVFPVVGEAVEIIGASYVHFDRADEALKILKAMLKRKTATIELHSAAELRMAYIYKSKGEEHSDFPFLGNFQDVSPDLGVILNALSGSTELFYIEDIRDWLQDIIDSDLDSKFEFEPVALASDFSVRHTDIKRLWSVFQQYQNINVEVHPNFSTFVTDTSDMKVSVCSVNRLQN